MKRSDALVPLSRDHHHGLAVAQQLRRATEQTAASARCSNLSTGWELDVARVMVALALACAAAGPGL
jgi:hypothetical protein